MPKTWALSSLALSCPSTHPPPPRMCSTFLSALLFSNFFSRSVTSIYSHIIHNSLTTQKAGWLKTLVESLKNETWTLWERRQIFKDISMFQNFFFFQIWWLHLFSWNLLLWETNTHTIISTDILNHQFEAKQVFWTDPNKKASKDDWLGTSENGWNTFPSWNFAAAQCDSLQQLQSQSFPSLGFWYFAIGHWQRKLSGTD